MLSLKSIRENKDYVQESLSNKQSKTDVDKLLELDSQRRHYLQEVEQLRAEKNKASNIIADLKKAGKSADEEIAVMRSVSEKVKEVETNLHLVENAVQSDIYYIPNIVHSTVPVGKDESENVTVREWGDKPEFSFQPKDHLELGDKLGLFDFRRSVKMAGSGFSLYTGLGAKLERALINFMLDFHTESHGYVELFPPFLANANAMQNTGQLPKFEADMYHIPEDSLYCIPTAEVPVTNIHQGEILSESDLPKKYAAYSACFRREAGSYGKKQKVLSGFINLIRLNW